MNFYSTSKDTAKIFYSHIPYNITDIELIVRDVNIDNYSVRIQYSEDNLTYSEFFDDPSDLLLEIVNLNEVYLGIEVIVHKFYNLDHTLFQLTCKLNNEFYLKDIFNVKFINDNKIIVSRRNGNLYDPYRLSGNQKILQNKLSRDLSEIYGHKVMYFKAVHDINDLDITFKEILKGEVKLENCKELKLVIKDNHIPDNRPIFEDLEISWENEFEVHVDKQVFKELYGDMIPNSNDYFYLPITKRMYRVNAPYNEKNFMQNDPYWKMMCIKWERRNDVIEDDFVGEIVDDLVDFREDYFADKYEDEKKDSVRPDNTPSDNIGECDFNILGNNIFKYYFNFYNIKNNKVVKNIEFVGKEFTYNSWVKSQFTGVNLLSLKIHTSNILKLEFNKDNKLVSTFQTIDNFQKVVINTSTTVFNKDKWYGIGISMRTQNTILTIVDSNLRTLEEIEINFSPLFMPQEVEYFGGIGVANIRVNKKYLTQATPITISDKLSEVEPSFRENYVIENAVPKIKE